MSENLKPITPRLTYISFLECELRGRWEDWIDEAMEQGMDSEDLSLQSPVAHNYRSRKGCELWIVRQDGLRMALLFKTGYHVSISGTTVRFFQDGILDELSVNEK